MKANEVQTGFVNASAAGWIPPTTTFASPPGAPATGSVYVFTDALTSGANVGGGSSLSICRWSGSTWVPIVASPYDLVCSFVGKPGAAATVLIFTAVRAVTFPANFSGSYGSVGVANTATAVYTVKNGSTTIGTITITASGSPAVVTFTFATTSGTAKALAAGDRMTIIAPSSQDATLSDVGFTLAGTR